MNRNTEKPWLSPLDATLLSNVSGFIDFLSSHTNKNTLPTAESMEISKKIEQLSRWTNFASRILKSPKDNYVDAFEMHAEKFNIVDSRLSGKVVKLIYATEAPEVGNDELDSYKLKRFDSDVSEDEGKRADGIFASSNASGETSVIVINPLEANERCRLKGAFVLDKCLRRVEKRSESREVFTAYFCHFNELSGKVLRVFPLNRYIVKRVGKTSNEFANNRLRREFKVQNLFTSLKHENINEIVHYFEDDQSMISVSKSAGNIDMLDYLAKFVKDHQRGFPEEAVRSKFKDVVEAFVLSHNAGIAHRDLSLENLVLNNFEHSREKIEIIDWGHAVSVAPGSTRCPHEGAIGKVRYMAPELVSGSGEYDPFKADVFALGVCLFSVLIGQMPFSKINDGRANILQDSAAKLIAFIDQRNVEGNNCGVSEECIDLLNKCLKWNPSERLTMEQVLNHRFFSSGTRKM